MPIVNPQAIIFKHMIELTSCGCVFCYTQEEASGRTRLFLVFKDQARVYSRNGLRGTWEEIRNEEESRSIFDTFERAVSEQKVPRFATAVNDLAYV
jgi:hypothetical protein